jgi:hypothetical protein
MIGLVTTMDALALFGSPLLFGNRLALTAVSL